ncbi:MAG TPA: very short patch repair endonuclease [Allosphingosinicella sp.]
MDNLTPKRRSEIMAQVRSKDTSAEVRVRKAAHGMGFRFRVHRKDLPGTPDLVFPKLRTAMFVHGCFWHQHPGCRRSSVPKTRAQFWLEKFRHNLARDQRVTEALEAEGWAVVVIWECETKSPDELRMAIRRSLSVSAESHAKTK